MFAIQFSKHLGKHIDDGISEIMNDKNTVEEVTDSNYVVWETDSYEYGSG